MYSVCCNRSCHHVYIVVYQIYIRKSWGLSMYYEMGYTHFKLGFICLSQSQFELHETTDKYCQRENTRKQLVYVFFCVNQIRSD